MLYAHTRIHAHTHLQLPVAKERYCLSVEQGVHCLAGGEVVQLVDLLANLNSSLHGCLFVCLFVFETHRQMATQHNTA